MTVPLKANLKVYQGSTFQQVFRWESATKIYKPITAIYAQAPVTITAAGHGCPVGWRTKVTNVGGMKEINSTDYKVVTSSTADTVTINEINALSYTAYTSGGVLEYNAPNILTGLTARCQIREKVSSLEFLDELTTENGGIVIDTSLYTITLNITAAKAALYTFKSAVYSIELINGITIIPFVYGDVSLITEITR
jgi:hypothetical protein